MTPHKPAVLTHEEDGILTITLNRPEARNAVDRTVAEEIAAALDGLDKRDDLRIAVLFGAGGTFSAGADLKAFARGERALVEGRGFAGFVERPPRKPLIAAVEGYALGGGCEMALACDLIIAASNARFGLPEVKRGLLANAGGLLRLPRQIPHRAAMEMVLTGEPIDAETALRLGLVNRVVDAGQALSCAMTMARAISANAPLAIAASKRIVNEAAEWPMREAFARQSAISQPVFDSTDAREGARAFAEKRSPVWSGR